MGITPWILCLIILLCWYNVLTILDASSVVIQAGECKFNPKYFENFTVSIENNSLNLDMVTKKVFDRGFKVHIDFSVSLAMKKNIFKAWFQSMLDNGNFMVNCPVATGTYYLHNWKLDPQLVPQYLYPGDYRVTGHFFSGKLRSKTEEEILDLIVYALLKTN